MSVTTSRRQPKQTKADETILAAAYVRMSTDRQEDSPERQRRQINEYAAKNGYQVVRWYEDHGQTGTESTKRTNYQQLLADSNLGAFTAVLISEQSRLSREDLFGVIPQWGQFRDAGITLVSCQRGVIDFGSMGGFLTAIIDQYSSNDESKKIADRTITGKLNRILKGERVGGNRLFGFDRNIVDSNGQVLKRVGFREKFVKSVDCKSLLVPSADTKSVEAIQWAFQHVRNGGSIGSVAKEFNRRGLVGVHGQRFNPSSVRQILTNPAYAGNSRSGKSCRGKFRRMSDDHEPILLENTHAGLVDRQTFEAVSAMIAVRAVSKDTWKTYLLSGLCRCGICGRPLSGTQSKNQNHRYCCTNNKSNAIRNGRQGHCDVLPSFDGPLLEIAVIRAWCNVFLADGVTAQLKLKPADDHSQHEQKELKSLSGQIERAEKNLALAENQTDFKTVSTILAGLRKRESELRNKLSKANRKLADLAPELQEAIENFKDYRTILEDWPNVGSEQVRERLTRDLAVLFKQTIESVVLQTTNERPEERTYYVRNMVRRTGAVIFNPNKTSACDAILSDQMLATPTRRRYRLAADYLRQVRIATTSAKIAEAIGVSLASARRSLAVCALEGTVRRIGSTWKDAAWISCESD